MTIDKEKKILTLLKKIIEESHKKDIKDRLDKVKRGELDDGGESFITFHLKLIKELILS